MDLKRFIRNHLLIVAKKAEPLETLMGLSKEERSHVAQNPNTPPEALQELARDEDWNVRYRVAQNPSTPPAALQELARDENEYVRSHVAQNPNTPPAAL